MATPDGGTTILDPVALGGRLGGHDDARTTRRSLGFQ